MVRVGDDFSAGKHICWQQELLSEQTFHTVTDKFGGSGTGENAAVFTFSIKRLQKIAEFAEMMLYPAARVGPPNSIFC